MKNENTAAVNAWVMFAAIILLIRGVVQVLEGIAALNNDAFFVNSDNQLVFFNLSGWGWIQIILGIVLVSGGVSLFSGHTWGKIIGVTATSFAIIANFILLPLYPLWAVLLIVMDIAIIYSIVVVGSDS